VKRLLTVAMALAIFVLVGCGPKATPTPEPTAPAATEAVQAATATATPTTPPPAPTATAQVPTATSEPEVAYPAPQPTADSEAYPSPPTPALPVGYPYPDPEDEAGEPGGGRWVFDGVISESEYDHQIVLGPVAVFWANDETHLYVALEAQTEGWLGIGFDPDARMMGADFIIASYDTEPRIWDAYGQALTGATHPPDTQIGGTFDIVAWAAVQDGPFFRFEALRPLDSGDPYDKPLERGQTYTIIVAVGTRAAFDAPHAYRGAGEITLD
jgi:hypothetical protein